MALRNEAINMFQMISLMKISTCDSNRVINLRNGVFRDDLHKILS